MSAQNDARFAQVLARLDGLHPATWQQNAAVALSTVVVALGLGFAVLAYASDRFDSGVGSMGAVEDAIDEQREINASQNERLDRILSPSF